MNPCTTCNGLGYIPSAVAAPRFVRCTDCFGSGIACTKDDVFKWVEAAIANKDMFADCGFVVGLAQLEDAKRLIEGGDEAWRRFLLGRDIRALQRFYPKIHKAAIAVLESSSR